MGMDVGLGQWLKKFALSIILILCCQIVFAKPQIANLDEQVQVEIGDYGWLYQPTTSALYEKSSIQPTLTNITAFSLAIQPHSKYFSTYSKKIAIPENLVGKWLSIFIPYQNSISKVSINGTPLVRVIQNDKPTAENEYSISPRLIFFQADDKILNIEIELIDNLNTKYEQNVSYDLGQSIVILKAKDGYQKQYRDFLIRTLLAGGILIFGIFTTLFAYYLNRQTYYYFIGILSIVVALRSSFATPYIYTLVYDIDWQFAVRIEFILCVLMAAIFINYLKDLYAKYFSKKIYILAVVLLMMLMLVIIFTPPVIFQRVFLYVISILFLMTLYSFYIGIKILREDRNAYPVSYLWGICVVDFAFLHDFFLYYQVIRTIDITLALVAVYILYVVFTMSILFARQVGNIERLNKNLAEANTHLDEKVEQRTEQLIQLNQRLERQSKIDALTGVYNRGYLNKKLEEQYIQAVVQTEKMSLMMLDIDFFKKYNDYYGHLQGDELIKTIAQAIIKNIPDSAFLGRYGGEEFVVILNNTHAEECRQIAQRICWQVENLALEHLGRPNDPQIVTISLGAVSIYNVKRYQNVFEILQLADTLLYQAKANGRNQISFWKDI